jgi:23S rRNA pseudouridine2605 synthase
MATVRLQKILARAGIASRRAAEALISGGHVRIDGHIVTELGTKVDPRAARIEVDGQRVVAESPVYLVLNKPRGVVSTMHDPEGRPTVKELLDDVPERVYPVGRLDFNTSGVLLATNDGEFADGLMHPRSAVPKTYVLKVQGHMEPKDLDQWRRGVELEDGKTLPAKGKLLRYEADKTWLELTITEGRNRQLRRMGDATGFRVMRLARVGFAGVTTEGLPAGRWRYLNGDELAALKKEYGVPRRVVHPPMPKKTAKKDERRPGHAHAQGKRPWVRRESEEAAERHPRYGGGAPVRRDLATREDWGGGVRRGSSGGRDDGTSAAPPRRGQEMNDRSPRADVGGRGGRSRTTGTGGGIGAGEGSYRVRGRRG